MRNVKPGHDRPVICLDAGHYAKYNRCPAIQEYQESVVNLKLHLLLKKELGEALTKDDSVGGDII